MSGTTLTSSVAFLRETMGHEAEDRRAEGSPVHEAGPRHRVGKCPPSPSQREAEVDCVSGAITALTDAGDDQRASMQRSTCTRPGFSLGRKSRPAESRRSANEYGSS